MTRLRGARPAFHGGTHRRRTRARIVVGVNGSSASCCAARWAAEWGAAQHLDVTLLTGCGTTPRTASAGEAMVADARAVLEQVADTLRRAHPSLTVAEQVVTTAPTTALVDASADTVTSTRAVVVGLEPARPEYAGPGVPDTTHPVSPLPGAHRGRLVEDLATHARTPVIAVPCSDVAWDGPVVVGVDGSAGSREATRFAFAHAARRGVPLVVFSICPGTNGPETTAARLQRSALVQAVVQPLRPVWPTVPVDVRDLEGDPGTLLATTELVEQDASLVVVGHRGRGRQSGPWLGSVTRAVLRRANRPVAVVRPVPWRVGRR